MIAITGMRSKSVLVVGLGCSGLATATALKAGEAKVWVYDDDASKCQAARDADFEVIDIEAANFSRFDALVLAPGISLTHPLPHASVIKAKNVKVPIIGDIELFCRERQLHAPQSTFIAITGTNGKSTTTALIGHLLQHAGFDVELGGNIGQAVLTLAPLSNEKCYVVECSSYQIDLAPSLKPCIGVHLNVTPDHLDRHGTVENYAAIKARLVLNADHAVIGIDDALSKDIKKQCNEASVDVTEVSLIENTEISARAGEVFNGYMRAVDVSNIASLRGRHNLQNAAIAYAVCHKLGVSDASMQLGMRNFRGLPHRLEQVGSNNGVLFINDSKATNADATAKALESFDSIYWILGGVAKSGGIEALERFFPQIVHAFLIGEASTSFAQTLTNKVPFTQCQTLDIATRKAVRLSQQHAFEEERSVAVLLSPACASFDQFTGFEMRGTVFRSVVFEELRNLRENMYAS